MFLKELVRLTTRERVPMGHQPTRGRYGVYSRASNCFLTRREWTKAEHKELYRVSRQHK